MQKHVSVGLVGDYDPSVTAHQAIPKALQVSAAADLRVEFEWVPTEEIQDSARVVKFDGLWCVPASPYRSTDGALLAIRYAREQGVPFLGTCGGFQHAILEYSRNVLGWEDAEHEEMAPHAERAVIAPLSCSLVEQSGRVHFTPGSRIATAYGTASAVEGYHCRYGLNPAFAAELLAGPLRATAKDDAGEVRAAELTTHPFYVATLFQPERAALKGQRSPVVGAFLTACSA